MNEGLEGIAVGALMLFLLLSLYRYATNQKDYQDKFDPQDYLQTYYPDSSFEQLRFVLKQVHTFYQSYKSSETKLKILDVGSGPVIAQAISAAPYASEIVLSDFAEANREALLQWLKNDPKAFDWTPIIKHVVVDLEGKSEEEVPVRAELVRKVIKAVVPCDVHSDPPIPTQYVNQYDIVTEFACLPASCTTKEEYQAALFRLCALVKPGGMIVLCEREGKESPTRVSYRVGTQPFSGVLFPKEIISMMLKQAGFCDVKIVAKPSHEFPTQINKHDYVGWIFVTACKAS